MSNIGLQELIYQVKRELLAPNQRENSSDPYPLFFIEKIELEIAVSISGSTNTGIQLKVLDFAELSSGKTVSRENSHVVKISLSPLESREEILKRVLQNPKVQEGIQNHSERLVKSGDGFDIQGQPE